MHNDQITDFNLFRIPGAILMLELPNLIQSVLVGVTLT